VKVVLKRVEETILKNFSMNKDHAKGLLTQAGYFLIFCFGLRGGSKLHSVRVSDIVLNKDAGGL
jgi:hypothetical protein